MPARFYLLVLIGLVGASSVWSGCVLVDVRREGEACLWTFVDSSVPVLCFTGSAATVPDPVDGVEARECAIPNRRLGFPSGRRIEDNGQFNSGVIGQRPARWEGSGVRHHFNSPHLGTRGCLGVSGLHLHQLDGTGRGEAYQVIDLEAFARPDTSFVGARALFDREDTGLSGPNPATEFELRLAAFDGLPTGYVHRITTPLATTNARLDSDNDRTTWEELTTSLLMPQGTRYLVVSVAVLGTAGSNVSTHYVDGVRVALLDELALPPYDLRLERFIDNRNTFSILLHNDGPNYADDPVIQISVPAGFNPNGDNSVTSGTFDPVRMEWTPGDLSAGGFRQLWLDGSSSDGTFTATLIRGLEGDLDASNNRLSAPTSEATRTYDLAIGEGTGISGSTYVPDDLFGAQIWIQNTGPEDAQGVEVMIPPDGYRVRPTSINASNGSFDPTTGLWSIGDLSPGQTAQLTFSARTTYASGSHTFVASVTDGLAGDTDASNNTVQAPFTIRNTSYDIRVNAPTPSTYFPSVGETFTVGFSFTNEGPDIVRIVEASVPLPSELTFGAFSGQSGITYDPATGLLTINGIGPNQTKAFTLTLSGTQRGIVTIPAEVTYAPADTDPSNDRFSVDIDVRR
ncbi:MAG: hypothetical protein Rubg2KO_17390 [Rubricoccaceae bacterium]